MRDEPEEFSELMNLADKLWPNYLNRFPETCDCAQCKQGFIAGFLSGASAMKAALELA